MVLVNPMGWLAKQASNKILSAVVLMLQNGSGKSIVNAHSDAVRMDERLHCNTPTLDIVGGGRSSIPLGFKYVHHFLAAHLHRSVMLILSAVAIINTTITDTTTGGYPSGWVKSGYMYLAVEIQKLCSILIRSIFLQYIANSTLAA